MDLKKPRQPIRTCLGCGFRDEQHKLIRLTVDGRGELRLRQSDGGRGGYLHAAPECWQAFLKRKSHYRAFRAEIAKSAKEKLVHELNERERE
jgi:predicted RNA-binding protein YlxR (DUF448 family)